MNENTSMNWKNHRAFTYVEMLIVLIIIMLAAAIAMPRLSAYEANQDLNAAAQELANFLSSARVAAMDQGQTVSVNYCNDNDNCGASKPCLVSTVVSQSPEVLQKFIMGDGSDHNITGFVSSPANIKFDASGHLFMCNVLSDVSFTLQHAQGNESLMTVYCNRLGQIRMNQSFDVENDNTFVVATSPPPLPPPMATLPQPPDLVPVVIDTLDAGDIPPLDAPPLPHR